MSIYTDAKLLLHADGVNGSTDIRDSSLYQHSITVIGNAQISSAQSKFGNGSLYCDGTGCVTVADDELFSFGSNNFAISVWIKRGATQSTQQQIVCQSNATEIGTSVSLSLTNTNYPTVWVYSGTTVYQVISSTTITDTINWHYLLGYRNGNILYLYVDGVLKGSIDVSNISVNNVSSPIGIGRYGGYDGFYYNGYIDELQIITGDSVSQIDPTIVPTAPFSYNPYMPSKDLMEGCVAYWDFRDGGLYDITSNKVATWSIGAWATDHFGYQNSSVDVDYTEQVTWTDLGTIGDVYTIRSPNSGTTWYHEWNVSEVYSNGINTGGNTGTAWYSIVIVFNRTMTTAERSQIESLLKERYIYPTQKAAMQE